MSDTGIQFLVGDIGGTRLRLRVVEANGDAWQIRHEVAWFSCQFDSLETAVQQFLDELSRAERCALSGGWFAVAGPVIDGRVRFTNLPWVTDDQALAGLLSLPEVYLVNDLEALAHAVPEFEANALTSIKPGSAAQGRALLVSVGTGLGLASWSRTPGCFHVIPSEGGHSDFAPRTEWQWELWRWMHSRHEHVSFERLASGPGLVNLYDFLHVQAGIRGPDACDGDQAAEIFRMAEKEGDERACAAIDHFARILGAFCANAALHVMATGGIHLAGGVIRHLHPYMREDNFGRCFRGKGRMAGLLSNIPVHAVTAPEPGLEGITRLAIRQLAARNLIS